MKFFKVLFLTLIIALFSTNAHAVTGNNEPDQYVSVRLLADKTDVKGGDTITIGIENTIYPKWHIYWINPGDSGTPLEAAWTTPVGFEFGAIQHPIPKTIDYGPLTNYGHEGKPVLLQTLKLPDTIPSGPITLDAKIDLLVCHDICIPESHTASLTLNGNQKAETAAIQKAQMKLPQKVAYQGVIREEGENITVTIATEDTAAFSNADTIRLLPIEWGIIDNTTKTSAKVTSDGVVLSHKKGDRALSEISEFPFAIAYTDPAGNEQAIELSISTSAMAAGSDITFIQALLLAIVGGLILNLMPCVFPVLSMKALSLVSLNDKEEKKARAYGLSYTAGILISFGLIAGLLIALKAGGAQIGWGFQLQNPIVIIVLSYLVFVIGLNLSGLFEFSGRFSYWGQNLATKSGHGGAFWTGVLATLVATPCTAPFMGAAIGFALTQNAFLSLLVFLGLGFGLALPYLILCYVPALRQKLPKPGAWMETFRQFLSFPMFITAAWLIWVLSQQAADTTLLATLVGMIAIVFGLWLLKRTPNNSLAKTLRTIFLIVAIVGVINPIVSAEPATQSISVSEESNWSSYSPETLSTALESKNPIFVNMTAAWCITCKVNERIALDTDKTRQLFSDQNITYLKGNWTNKDPEITKFLNQFDRHGVPLYVFYPAPDEKTGERPDPVLLPQLLTKNIIFETISDFDTNKE